MEVVQSKLQSHPQTGAGLSFEILSSMVTELLDDYDRHCQTKEFGFDWQSPSARTQIVRFGTRSYLDNVLKQNPNDVALEYQLFYCRNPVFSWHEYRWPHLLSEDRQLPDHLYIDLPQDCIDELMRYHICMQTSWIERYRARLMKLA